MKRTILVIEGEKVTRDNLLKFLTSEGFNAYWRQQNQKYMKLISLVKVVRK